MVKSSSILPEQALFDPGWCEIHHPRRNKRLGNRRVRSAARGSILREVPGRVLATRVLLILCAACAGEPAPARPVNVDVPRLASDPTPRTDREQAAPYPETASDPAPVRSTPSDPTMASCLAGPVRIADQRYSEIPFTTTQRIQLRRLLAGVEGQCMAQKAGGEFRSCATIVPRRLARRPRPDRMHALPGWKERRFLPGPTAISV